LPVTPVGCRVEFVATTANPGGRWVTQQARNLIMQLNEQEQQFRCPVRDRDSKFSFDFDTVLRSAGIRIIRTPVRAPNANAHAERWAGTFRRECLDRILILNRRHLDAVLRTYVEHFNRHRRHRVLSLQPPETSITPVASPVTHIEQKKLLGGLINEYKAAASRQSTHDRLFEPHAPRNEHGHRPPPNSSSPRVPARPAVHHSGSSTPTARARTEWSRADMRTA
jgi:hypothetical protein